MEISIRIREKLRKGLITVCLFYCGFHSALLGQSLSRSKQNNNMVTSRHYSSAFAGPQNKVVSSFSFGEYDFRDTLPGKNYTIQLFTSFDTPADPILTESNKIKIIRMGELYRYIFSQYHALDTARQALIPIRRLYPQACIREYQEGKLGPIIDMNIDHRINDKTYDVSDTLTPFSHFTLKKYIENAHVDIYTSKQLRLMITRVDTQEPIGLIDLYDFDPYHQRAGLGIMIHNMENRKQGYASSAIKLMLDYCFETLGLNQVYSSVPSCNVASLKLFEATGFTQTGYRKQWLKRGNEWEDVIYFQQLASTWNNN